MEVSRDDLARQQGQYKGRIAKLEGAISSGEKRLQATILELEATKTRCLRLQAERDQLESQTGVTPERCRIERVNLQAKAKKAVKLVYDTDLRIKELTRIVDHEAQQRQELTEFASLEHMAAADAESSIGSQVALLEARLAEQTAALDGARKEAADAQASLRSMESELQKVTEAHAPCAAAAAKAQQELTLLHSHVQQLTQDRAQAANNIRIAEKEVDLIHQANEQMFRYLNYAPQPSKTPGHTPAPKGFASRTPIASRSRLGLFGA
ncbi:hypothetical protein WJX75_004137 [Coccomyxa subellipsoidea]|uniref:Uncharacterized protein n=1 Tax=Coccomyxa subellipsoidea TaxID=248742 RepID=A0ABR2YF24_9CHLO